VNKILIEEYPKMEGVEGWLFYKASGGHGRRKLLAIPPDVDGYTGRLIRSVSGAGKTTMYIVPLQQDLDLTPLPSDATEFQKMPKAACQVCKENMPLHILALHIEDCMKSAADDDEDWQSEVQVLSVTNSPLVRPNKESRDCGQDRKECPICCGCFPSDEIVLHASLCGESLQDTLNYSTDSCVLREGSLSMADMSSDDDVLQWLASQDFKICITRDNLFQRGLIQWQRQKKGSPVNKLDVTFIGEAGIDTGALSKEFLTGDFDALQLTKDDVDDLEYALLIERVEAATDLTQFTDEIPDADYIMSIIVPELSEKGSPRQARENAIINFLQDFLQDLEITGLT
ncbi:hypothetical protein DPX16_3519, partial [Anabarilius grahami]